MTHKPYAPASPDSTLIARGNTLEGQIWNFAGSEADFAEYNSYLCETPELSGPLPFPVVEVLKTFNERGRAHERVLVLSSRMDRSISTVAPIELGRVFSLSRFDFDDDAGLWELVWGPKIRRLHPKYFVDDLEDSGESEANVLFLDPIR